MTRSGVDPRPAATWDDLVLPSVQLQAVHDIALQVRHRATVYEKWGFSARDSRASGTSALFAGESGTGKTLAAEILANYLEVDLYRIHLSSYRQAAAIGQVDGADSLCSNRKFYHLIWPERIFNFS
jgi:SpoVK/Ycf46/Vps4 family AAA+-type ATPase